MVDSGHIVPTGRLVTKGSPANVVYRNLGTVTNGYPGRLAVRENTDYDVKVSDGVLPPLGWIGYEQQATQYQVADITTINVVDTEVPVISGGGFTIYMPSGLAKGTVATQGDCLLSWAEGKVVPGAIFGGRVAVKVPFSKSTDEVSTITLPAGVVVRDVFIDVVTNENGGTIDVGTLEDDSGDADGFLDGELLTTAGLVQHNIVDATANNNTLGALLVETDITTADSPALYLSSGTGYLVPSGGKVLTYTTSNTTATVAGYIYVVVESPGVRIVGKSGTTVNAASATAGVFVETSL